MLGHAANEAFRRGLFVPLAPDRDFGTPRKSVLFSMSLDQTIPMRVWLSDWDCGEARIAAALWPTEDADCWLHAVRADELAGEVFTSGYLIRGSRVRLAIVDDPVIFIRPSRREAMKRFALPRGIEDDLQLFPRRLSISTLV